MYYYIYYYIYYTLVKINNDGDPKFKIGDIVRILKYKNIWSEEVFVIKKVKNTVILKAKKLLERFAKNNCKKQIKKNLELKK